MREGFGVHAASTNVVFWVVRRHGVVVDVTFDFGFGKLHGGA